MIVPIRIDLTTNAAGAATGYGRAIVGRLVAIQLVDGSFDDGVDLTLTAEHADLSIPLLTKADWNTDQMVYPKAPTAAVADGSALTDYEEPLVYGRPKAVIAQGGNTKTGAVILYVEQE